MYSDCRERERDLTFRLGFEIITSVKNEYSGLGFVTVSQGPFVSIFRVEEWGEYVARFTPKM